MPIVDIIVPVHNTPSKLLERCFLSILNQTYKECRAIIVNDGSDKKETLELLCAIKKKPVVQVYNKTNSGVSDARNYGLRRSCGDYVLFLDSDDYIDNDYVEKMVKVIEDKKTDIVFSGRINSISGRNDAPFNNHKISMDEDAEIIVIQSQAFTCSAALIAGPLARSISFSSKITIGEDTEYIIKAMFQHESYYAGWGGNYYVQNENSATHTITVESIDRYLNESARLCSIFREYLNVDNKIVELFLYVKLIRAYEKLNQNGTNLVTVNRIAKEYIKNYSTVKVGFIDVVKNKSLKKGEKIRMIFLIRQHFLVAYLFDRVISTIKNGRAKNDRKKKNRSVV